MNLRSLSLLKTIILWRHLTSTSYKRLCLRVHKHTTLDIDKSAKIILQKGILSINKSWIPEGDNFRFLLHMGPFSSLKVDNTFDIYSGGKIYINKGAHLHLGSGYINHNVNISVFKEVSIGNQCVISENVVIRDSDNHTIISKNNHNNTAPVIIEDHVWIGMNVTILKGVHIGHDTVIAANSLVNKDIPPHSLAAGIPAKVVRTNIYWE